MGHNFNKTEKSVIEKMQGVLAKHLPKDGEAILYGSCARGDARADSDWDVLILLNKRALDMSDYTDVSYPLTELGCDLGETISPMLYTKEEWKKYSFTPFYKNIQAEGIRL